MRQRDDTVRSCRCCKWCRPYRAPHSFRFCIRVTNCTAALGRGDESSGRFAGARRRPARRRCGSMVRHRCLDPCTPVWTHWRHCSWRRPCRWWSEARRRRGSDIGLGDDDHRGPSDISRASRGLGLLEGRWRSCGWFGQSRWGGDGAGGSWWMWPGRTVDVVRALLKKWGLWMSRELLSSSIDPSSSSHITHPKSCRACSVLSFIRNRTNERNTLTSDCLIRLNHLSFIRGTSKSTAWSEIMRVVLVIEGFQYSMTTTHSLFFCYTLSLFLQKISTEEGWIVENFQKSIWSHCQYNQ